MTRSLSRKMGFRVGMKRRMLTNRVLLLLLMRKMLINRMLLMSGVLWSSGRASHRMAVMQLGTHGRLNNRLRHRPVRPRGQGSHRRGRGRTRMSGLHGRLLLRRVLRQERSLGPDRRDRRIRSLSMRPWFHGVHSRHDSSSRTTSCTTSLLVNAGQITLVSHHML